jgi:hypothetical protein
MVFDDDRNIRTALAQIDAMIVHTGDRLSAVLEKFDADLHGSVGLILMFPQRQIILDVRPEDDSVDVSVNSGTEAWLLHPLLDVSRSFPWAEALNKSLVSFCILLNNRGYVDGVQLEFSNSIMENSVFGQIVGAGSLLHVRDISEAKTLKRATSQEE